MLRTYRSFLVAWAKNELFFGCLNFGKLISLSVRKKKFNIQRVSKIIIMQVTFTRIQQSSIKSKQNLLPSKIETYR